MESLAINDCLKMIDYVMPVSKRLWEKAAIKYKILNEIPFKVLHPPIDTDEIISACQKPTSNAKYNRPLVVTEVVYYI